MNSQNKFENILQKLISINGSDLHIREDRPVYLRNLKIVNPVLDVEPFTRAEILELLRNFMTKEKLESFGETKSIDFSAIALGRRLRGNAFLERGKISLTMRLIPAVKSVQELKLPEVLHTIALQEQGFFLVTGSVGNGKSTTVASMVSVINKEKLR